MSSIKWVNAVELTPPCGQAKRHAEQNNPQPQDPIIFSVTTRHETERDASSTDDG